MDALAQKCSFDDVEPHRLLPAEIRVSMASACELVLGYPSAFGEALAWLNEWYSEAAVLYRELQSSERTSKSLLWNLRHHRAVYDAFPRRSALRAARPQLPESRRLALLVKYYSVPELAHLTSDFIVNLSKHPEEVRDWVVQLTIDGLRGARIRGGQLILSNDRLESDAVVDSSNVETAWDSLDQRCRQRIQDIRAERKERNAKIYEQVKNRGARLRRAAQDTSDTGLPAGREEEKHSRRLVLLACLLTYQHELPLVGEFGSWQWESDGFIFAQLVGAVYAPGRESALFNPTYRRGERFDATCINIPDFSGFADLVGRAVRILRRSTSPSQLPVASPPKQEKAAEKAASRTEWLAKAMLAVQEKPDWSDARIARSIHKSAGTLSRSDEYQAAATMARGRKSDLPRGNTSSHADSGIRDVVAVAPQASPPEDQSDRGGPIPRSKYFREYCAECREAMKVSRDKVGTKPRCDRCAR